jgi:hypothetical protein
LYNLLVDRNNKIFSLIAGIKASTDSLDRLAVSPGPPGVG